MSGETAYTFPPELPLLISAHKGAWKPQQADFQVFAKTKKRKALRV